MIGVDFHEDGLLWLINKTCFHPRGFALAHDRVTDQWSLLGNGTEPWAFQEGTDDTKFLAAEATLELARQSE